MSRTTPFKLNSIQSQFASRPNDHASFRPMIEESHSKGQAYNDKELNLFGFTKPFNKQLDKSFNFENIEDKDQNVDLELKL